MILTIDREIQARVEEILDAHIVESGASSGTITVMEPGSGEILAMATYPRLDMRGDWELKPSFRDGQVFNMAITGYEPGSVFKVVTMAGALDSGTVTQGTRFVDQGVIWVGGRPIYNWDRGAWGPQTMTTCLQHSLNVCLAWVATQMGPTLFYEYVRDFGFGQLTGIELDTEYRGSMRVPGDEGWHEIDLGTNSFGQGIAVTPVQMLQAVSAVANQGKMVRPHVLKAVINQGHQYEIDPEVTGSPISAETAQTLTEMLTVSLEKEASSALVPGYKVAGKTGTAEIYSSSLTNASFVGWAPVDDPQFMVYIWLHKPTTSPWASIIAAPVFRDVVENLVVLMDIPPDNVRHGMAAP